MNNRFYGQKGSSWRDNMNTVMLNDGIWEDMKYTLNGNTYIIPAKHLASKGRTDICINACKTNNTEIMNKMGIKMAAGG